ncbi:hypothetical protein CKM354_001016800 [Cercospora kikuchii]|uniref:non-specific serine/threonine protein kinase n=1 Tax=Cercospora kikuchii TaxID=84275 RepID=A0A9P3CPP9_9PEZI|nr:uncharacterized protein CKM354_001016800 [Cercospora kikuchii]GIZ47067.1 hypothetical protein CKM354_001016800 [Cercospora kikuchii]
MSDKFAAALSAIRGMVSKLSPIIGPTQQATLDAASAEKAQFQPTYFSEQIFETSLRFPQSAGGDVYIMRLQGTNKRFVRKHTRKTSRIDYDGRPGSLPNEAKILQDHVRPHPRIVSLLASFQDHENPTRWNLWMKFYNGGPLSSQYAYWQVKHHMPMPEPFLLHTIIQTVEALAFLHHGLRYAGNGRYTRDTSHQAIIHGDIKGEQFVLVHGEDIALDHGGPEHIGDMPNLVLLDFGTSRLESDTSACVEIGTIIYGSPEDLAITQGFNCGAAHVSELVQRYVKAIANRTIAHDIYSLGLLLSQYASQRREPHEVGFDVAKLEVLKEYETPGLAELLRKMLAIKPEERAIASFDAERGILPAIHELRKARDQMIAARGPIDCAQWATMPSRLRKNLAGTG